MHEECSVVKAEPISLSVDDRAFAQEQTDISHPADNSLGSNRHGHR